MHVRIAVGLLLTLTLTAAVLSQDENRKYWKHAEGGFEHIEGKKWVETDKFGAKFDWVEKERSKTQVKLYDARRKVSITIGPTTGIVQIGGNRNVIKGSWATEAFVAPFVAPAAPPKIPNDPKDPVAAPDAARQGLNKGVISLVAEHAVVDAQKKDVNLVKWAAFAPDGKSALVARVERNDRLPWQIYRLDSKSFGGSGRTDGSWRSAWSGDGSTLVLASRPRGDGKKAGPKLAWSIEVVDKDLKRKHQFDVNAEEVDDLSISRDGNVISFGSKNGMKLSRKYFV